MIATPSSATQTPAAEARGDRRRAWVRPQVRTEAARAGAVLLCTSDTPYDCFGGSVCCDVSPDCDTICGGG